MPLRFEHHERGLREWGNLIGPDNTFIGVTDCAGAVRTVRSKMA